MHQAAADEFIVFKEENKKIFEAEVEGLQY